MMANHHAFGNWTVVYKKRKPTRQHRTPTKRVTSISFFRAFSAGPYPAFVWICHIYVLPEFSDLFFAKAFRAFSRAANF